MVGRERRTRRRARFLAVAAIVATAGCSLVAGLGDAPVVPPPTDDSGSSDAASSDATTGPDSRVDAGAMDATRVDGNPSDARVATLGHIAAARGMVYAARRQGTYSWGDFDDDSPLRALHRRDPDASTKKPGEVLGPDGGLFRVDEVSGSLFHVCARVGDLAYCWGTDLFTLLGGSLKAPSTTPVVGPGNAPLGGILQVAAGGYFSCARRASDVLCWGGGGDYGKFAELGQLGDPGASSEPAVAIPGLGATRTIAVGHHHACAALEPAGHVVCWGRNDLRQAGSDAGAACPSGACVSPPTEVAGLRDVQQLALGSRHSCALTTAGEVFCWGGDLMYALGSAVVTQGCTAIDPPETSVAGPCTATPQRVPLDSVDAIAAGEDVSCAVKGGKVYCWGGNSPGPLGGGPSRTAPSPTPSVVLTSTGELTGMREVSLDLAFGCAIGAADAVYCWGPGGALGSSDPNVGMDGYAVPVVF